MKKIVFQMACMSICTLCAFMLTVLMFVYCVEHQGAIDYTHAVFGSLFALVLMWCTRVLCDLGREYQELKNQYEQHMLDMADDYASREY